MNKQRKTSHILNVFQYDDATGIIGLNGAPVSGYGLYLTTNINDGSVGIDSSASINALYLLKNTTKQFEISYDTSGAAKIFRLLPYQSGSFFQIGNPSNAANSNSDYVFISEATYGNVLIGPGIGNGTGNLTGATASIHKVQFNGAVFANNSIQATSFKITGGASTGFLKADGTVDAVTYLSGNQSITVSGDATGSGTTSIALTLANTAVTPGVYGSTTLVPVVTVDSKGRITSVTTAAISGSLTFTGDVTGSGTTGTSTAMTLAASGVTAGTYTKVTVDSKGRVTVGASATTSDISEGTNLYYTDARVLSYLSANTYATQSYVNTQVSNLVAAAPATLDTLNELAAALGNDPSFATTISTALGNRLRVDINNQGLSATLQGYGRTNLGLGTAATSNTGDFVAYRTFGTAANSAIGDFVAYRTFGTAANNNTGDFALASHTHSIANVTGLQTALDGKQASGSYAAATHSHIISDVTGLQTALDGKQASLGYTPYNSTNPSGYISSYTETSTLQNVTSRGNTTTTSISAANFQNAYQVLSLNNIKTPGLYNYDGGITGTQPLGTEWYNIRTIEIGADSRYSQFVMPYNVDRIFYRRKTDAGFAAYVELWHSGNLTNNNQLTNGAGYITGINSSAVTTALGFTPYNATNPSGYIGINNQTYFGINNTSNSSGNGISLYGAYSGGEMNYGIMFAGTPTFGTHGSVTGDWATYFTMNPDNTRGWIFRKAGSANVASISGGGNASFSGTISASNFSGSHSGTNTGDQTLSGLGGVPTSGYAFGTAFTLGTMYVGTGAQATVTSLLGVYSNGYTYTFGVAAVQTFLGLGTAAYQAANQSLNTSSGPTFTNIYNSAWFRNNNVNEGVYNQSTGTHFYSGSGTGWTITGSGSTVELVFRSNHQSTLRGYVYADTSNNIGFLTNDGNWGLQVDSSKNVKVFGADLTVGNTTSSNIYMTDTDESTRRIHCNSGRIGFLTTANGWGAYCDNSGNWFAANLSGTNTGDQTNISGNAATATAAQNATFLTQPNATWGGRVQLGGNGGGGAATVAVVQATNGNLHMDGGSGNAMYLNYYNNGVIYLNGGTYNISANGSQYNGNSATATTAARATRADGNFYIDDNYGNTVVGVYTSTRYQGVFAMGDAYKLPADGTTTGSLYGLAWSHPNAGGVAGNLNTHGLLVMENGTFLAAVSGSIRARDDMRAPIFYDSNDTAYYLNLAGGSRLRNLYVGDSGDDWSDPGGWGTQVRFSNGPHVKFVLHARTPGIEAGMYVHTPGSVFIGSYTSHDVSLMYGGSRKMGFNASYIYTDVYLEAAGSVRAPLFYDSENTAYYLDPAGTSNLNKFTGFTMAYNDMNPMSANSPYVARYNGSAGYRNGTMGSGNTDFNTIFSNWGSGFIDSWSSPANAPGGSSHYVGLQGLHYSELNTNTVYGFQMACAGEADNRFFWRSSWPSKRSWVEMIHSGTIGSQSVSYASSAGSAGSVTGASTMSGYLTVSANWSTSPYTSAFTIIGTYPSMTLRNSTADYEFLMHSDGAGDLQYYFGPGYTVNNWTQRYTFGRTGNFEVRTGTITASGDITAYSDIRVKENIEVIENALEKVKAIRGVTFNRTDLENNKGARHTGVIAQEVLEVLPEVIKTNDKGIYSVAYGNMVGLLIEAIKEQQLQIEELKNKLDNVLSSR